jgi:hypothetical protein
MRDLSKLIGSSDGEDSERAVLLDSIEWAWPRWQADDPRWHTATALFQTIADDEVREGVNEADVAWAKAMQEAVDAIDDRGREVSELTRLHRVIEAGESMIKLANRALRLHAEVRERQMQRGFGELFLDDDGCTLEASDYTHVVAGEQP